MARHRGLSWRSLSFTARLAKQPREIGRRTDRIDLHTHFRTRPMGSQNAGEAKVAQRPAGCRERSTNRTPPAHDRHRHQSRRGVASRRHVTTIEQTLYDAFGQPFVTQLYAPLSTYHVVLEAAPQYQQDVSALSRLYVHGASGKMIPISQFAALKPAPGIISVNHQGQFAAVVLSFNLSPGVSLGNAVQNIQQAETEIGKPASAPRRRRGRRTHRLASADPVHHSRYLSLFGP
jgi:AcrB/AcrD/AcrF family